MATDARLATRRLDVLRHGGEVRGGVRIREVAMKADRIHIGLNQQLRIRSAVREVAGAAAFRLDRSVLKDEGSSCCYIAFGVHHELPCRRAQRILFQVAMRIVAVCARDQTLFDLVMNGRGELWLDVIVALEAELRLRRLQQMLLFVGRVNVMAADAAHIALAVG